jgi:hypothetical protein
MIHNQMFKFFPVILLKDDIKKKVDQNHMGKNGLLIEKLVLGKKKEALDPEVCIPKSDPIMG